MDELKRERHKAYMREYLKNPENKAKHQARVRLRKEELRDFVRSLKDKCVRCGESRPQALDFHHLDGMTKSFNLGDIANSGYGKEKILEEISKCELICANCHRVEHADW